MDEIDRQYEELVREMLAMLEEMECSLKETVELLDGFLLRQQECRNKEELCWGNTSL